MSEEYCISKIHQDTNQRIYERNIPSQILQPYFDFRPANTKYTYFPIVQPLAPAHVPLQVMPVYNSTKVFNPGNTQSPWSGFAANINTESELFGQIYALQKCSQSVYVPESKSDLYETPMNTNSRPTTHSLLFESQSFCPFDPNPDINEVGTNLFLNPTRVQIRNMGEK
jgi:hypothetical protein